jgi:hypothetical protein
MTRSQLRERSWWRWQYWVLHTVLLTSNLQCFATLWQFKTLCLSSVYICILFQSSKAPFETPYTLLVLHIRESKIIILLDPNILCCWYHVIKWHTTNRNYWHQSRYISALTQTRTTVRIWNHIHLTFTTDWLYTPRALTLKNNSACCPHSVRCVLGMILTTNSDYSPNSNNSLVFVMETGCFLWGTNWISIYYLHELRALKG